MSCHNFAESKKQNFAKSEKQNSAISVPVSVIWLCFFLHQETPCDLVTGEDRRQANPDHPAEHVACTVEMTSLTNNCKFSCENTFTADTLFILTHDTIDIFGLLLQWILIAVF